VFGEREWHCRGKLELPEVVTICNHLIALGATEPEHKIFRETLRVAFDLLIQALGGHVVLGGRVEGVVFAFISDA